VQESTLASQMHHSWWKELLISLSVMILWLTSFETTLSSRWFQCSTQMASLTVTIDAVLPVVTSIVDGNILVRIYIQLSGIRRSSFPDLRKKGLLLCIVICMVTQDARMSSSTEMNSLITMRPHACSHSWCPRLLTLTSATTIPSSLTAGQRSRQLELQCGESLAPRTPTFSPWRHHSAARSQWSTNQIVRDSLIPMR